MKTEIHIPKPAEQKEAFPALYKSKSSDLTILVCLLSDLGNGAGFVMASNGSHKIGSYSSNWDMSKFTRLSSGAKITLEQE